MIPNIVLEEIMRFKEEHAFGYIQLNFKDGGFVNMNVFETKKTEKEKI